MRTALLINTVIPTTLIASHVKIQMVYVHYVWWRHYGLETGEIPSLHRYKHENTSYDKFFDHGSPPNESRFTDAVVSTWFFSLFHKNSSTCPVCIFEYLFDFEYLNLVYTKTVNSVEGTPWLATQTPNILCYSTPSDSRGICPRKYFNRCWNKLDKIVFMCYIFSLF